MARFVVDVSAVLRLAAGRIEIPREHQLLAPTLLRSQALSALHEAVQRGELSADIAQERLGYVAAMKMRLLGDAVLRKLAWEIADELGWASTYNAEYIALTRLQADALVTTDKEFARAARKLVEVAPIAAVRSTRPAGQKPGRRAAARA